MSPGLAWSIAVWMEWPGFTLMVTAEAAPAPTRKASTESATDARMQRPSFVGPRTIGETAVARQTIDAYRNLVQVAEGAQLLPGPPHVHWRGGGHHRRRLPLAFGGAPGVRRDQLLDPCDEPRHRLRCHLTAEQLRDCAQRFLGTAGTMLDECQAATRQRQLLASGFEGLPQGHEALSRRGMSRPPGGHLATQVATACDWHRSGR